MEEKSQAVDSEMVKLKKFKFKVPSGNSVVGFKQSLTVQEVHLYTVYINICTEQLI